MTSRHFLLGSGVGERGNAHIGSRFFVVAAMASFAHSACADGFGSENVKEAAAEDNYAW